MADVIAITHNVNYEVNTAGLEKATAVIHAQLEELQQLNKVMGVLQQQMQSSGTEQAATFKKLSQHIEDSSKQYEKLAAKAKGAMSQIGKGISEGLGVGGGVAGFAQKATEAVVSFVQESMALASQVSAIQSAFDSLDNPDLLTELRAAVRDTVSDLELMKQAVAYNNIGVPVEQMGNVFAFARIKAKETGMSVEEVVNTIVTGIGNESADALRKLGIDTAKLGAAFKETGNFAAETFAIIAEEVSKLDSAVLSVEEKQAQLAASMQNQQADIDKTFNEMGGYVKAFLADFVTEGNFTLTQAYHKNLQEAEKLAEDQKVVHKNAHDIMLQNFSGYLNDYANADYHGREKIKSQATTMYNELLNNAKQYYKNDTKAFSLYAEGLNRAYANLNKGFSQSEINLKEFDKKDVGKYTKGELLGLKHRLEEQQDGLYVDSTLDSNRDILKAINAQLAKYSSNNGGAKVGSRTNPLEAAVDRDKQLQQLDEKEAALYNKYAALYRDANTGNALVDESQRSSYEETKNDALKRIASKRAIRLNELALQYETDSDKIRQLKIEKAKLNEEEEKLRQEDVMPSLSINRSSAPVEPAHALKEVAVPEIKTQEELAEARKEHIKQAVADYQALSQAAVDAYNTILQVQIDALDKEIAIREKRVAAAQKLAERGNVEALKIEEDSLQKAQEMRAQFARRQQAVNAAITVSNAIAAVARAALEGGGFGSVATIAALLAALAAGYASVTSMSNDNAYADGVVDFKGKGGPREDANWVRISSGESVITADGTQKNRHLLQAINNGAQLQFINPALAYTIPAFATPQFNSQGYASGYDLRMVEGKLDGVINAIEDNRMKQNIFFNEHGVGIMTERAVRKDRKRWM